MEYLEFELPIKQIKEQYEKCKLLGEESGVDVEQTCKQLEKKLEKTIKDIYTNLTPWQRIEVSRHINRPHTLDYINTLAADTFIELFGDRTVYDDKAMIGGFGKIDKQSFLFVGHQKGRNTKERQYRRFGMPNPEGYRKALRLMKMAEKFNVPVITFIDTPGAYPGLEAEQRGQAEAIARNLFEMSLLKVPIISIVIGEGASGGALGIGLCDKTFMLENTWYSVISPESCSSILWRSWEHKKEAAKSLKLTSYDMKKNQLIDEIIKEPLGGAHANPKEIFKTVKQTILTTINELKSISLQELLEHRQDKYSGMGKFKG